MRTKNAPLVVALSLLLFTLTVTDSRGESWNGITPLRSTRRDVERILGKENENGYYQQEIGKVRIVYGSGEKDSKNCIGRAPTDVVAWININLDIPMSLSDLKMKDKGFKRIRNNHLPDVFDTSNAKLGITYSLGRKDMEVYSITYWPTKNDCEKLY